MTGSMLAEAADWFKARQTDIWSWYEDDRGRYAFRTTVDGQDFIVCAKKYLKAGDASFMEKKVCRRAIDSDALLLLFVMDGGCRYVFDPEAVLDHGDRVDPGDSPRATGGEDWVDISARFGVPFQDWYDGLKDPPRNPTWDDAKADGGQQGLDAFNGGDADG